MSEVDAPVLGGLGVRGLSRWFLGVPAVTTLVGLSLAGTFSSYVADDFDIVNRVHRDGFWGMQTVLYQTWSGRVSATFLLAALKSMGPWTATVLPGVLCLVWFIGNALALGQLAPRMGLAASRGTRWLVAACWTAVLLLSTPTLFQTMFWETGSLSYLLPQAIVPWIGFVAMRRQSWLTLASGVALTFVAVSSSETAMMVIMAVLAYLAVFVPSMRRRVAPLVFGGAIAAVIVLSSPGNAIRSASFGWAKQTMSSTEYVALALGQLAGVYRSTVVGTPWSFVVVVLSGVGLRWLGPSLDRVRGKFLRFSVLLGAIIPLAVLSVSSVTTARVFPRRSLAIVEHAILVAILISVMSVEVHRRRPARASTRHFSWCSRLGVVTAGAFLVWGTATRIPKEFLRGQAFDREVHRLEHEIRNAPKSTRVSLTVPQIAGGLYFVSPNEFTNPDGFWARRVGRTDVDVRLVSGGLWGPYDCDAC